MLLSQYIKTDNLKSIVAHLTVIILLLVNMVFLTHSFISTVLQVVLIVLIVLYYKHEISLKIELEAKEHEKRVQEQSFIEEVNEKELLLSKQTNRFEFAINSSRDGFWDYDLETKEFYLSTAWKKRLGFRTDEIVTYQIGLSIKKKCESL